MALVEFLSSYTILNNLGKRSCMLRIVSATPMRWGGGGSVYGFWDALIIIIIIIKEGHVCSKKPSFLKKTKNHKRKYE